MRIYLKIFAASFISTNSNDAVASGCGPSDLYENFWEFAADMMAPTTSPAQRFVNTPLIEGILSSMSCTPKGLEEAQYFIKTLEALDPKLLAFFEANVHFKNIMNLFSTQTKFQHKLMEMLLKIKTDDLAPLAFYLDQKPELKMVLNENKLMCAERYNVIYTCTTLQRETLDIFVRNLYTHITGQTSPIEPIIINLISKSPGPVSKKLAKIAELKEVFLQNKNPKLVTFLETNAHFQNLSGLLLEDSTLQESLVKMFYEVCLEMGTKPVARLFSDLDKMPKLKAILHDKARTPKEIYKIIRACVMDIYIHDHDLDTFACNLYSNIQTMQATESVESVIKGLISELEDSEDTALEDEDEDEDLPSKPKKSRTAGD